MSKAYYEILPVTLPLVQILCYDESREEEITVLEDTTGWSLNSVIDACEVKFDEWVASK
tara:strand:+ start:77 stop:253 length:177 start_codon:yes stop_codon:yes gene_type:complete